MDCNGLISCYVGLEVLPYIVVQANGVRPVGAKLDVDVAIRGQSGEAHYL